MDVLVAIAKQQDEWLESLRECLPQARFHLGPDAPSCDYAVIWQPPSGLLEGQPRLKALFSIGAGVNAVLAMPSLPRDVPLVRMEDGGMAAQMEEFALYVALRELRRFGRYEQAQAGAQWKPKRARARGEFRVGVLGLGVLGGAVACALAEFGFDVSGWSRSAKQIGGVRCEHGAPGLDAVLASSELLMLFLPVTGETDGLLDRERLSRLPRGAAVANLSRGELMVDEDLIALLDSGHLSTAYLDVFRREPLPAGHPFWSHPSIRVTPHIAALTDIGLASAQIAGKIRTLEAGGAISGVVDRRRGY
ncbi:MAG: glyoxylate/hydroxypyruvate reductase A [Pseudomonadota bacterium]|nr:glyoxylate/hydroxypyruvate reductase A [Pseudomonadota bacterium]